MRALISLYHQCDTFVTYENLEERINETFAKGSSSQLANIIESGVHKGNLQNLNQSRLTHPRLSIWEDEGSHKHNVTTAPAGTWSVRVTQREAEVREALYGVDRSDNRRMLPGLEVLKEGGDIPVAVKSTKPGGKASPIHELSVEDAYLEEVSTKGSKS